jgi:hypothetical protein
VGECLDALDLEKFLTGDLDADSGRAVREHVSRCASCGALLDEVAENLKLMGPIAGVLAAWPGRRSPTSRPRLFTRRSVG